MEVAPPPVDVEEPQQIARDGDDTAKQIKVGFQESVRILMESPESNDREWIYALADVEAHVDKIRTLIEASPDVDRNAFSPEENQFLDKLLPETVHALFFKCAVASEQALATNRFFQAVLRLGRAALPLDYFELCRVVLMLLDGPVHRPRTAPQAAAAVNAAPNAADSAPTVTSIALAVHSLPGLRGFYSYRGQPKHVYDENNRKIFYWPMNPRGVLEKMHARIGDTVELTPHGPPKNAAPPREDVPARPSSGRRIVKILAYDLKTDTYTVEDEALTRRSSSRVADASDDVVASLPGTRSDGSRSLQVRLSDFDDIKTLRSPERGRAFPLPGDLIHVEIDNQQQELLCRVLHREGFRFHVEEEKSQEEQHLAADGANGENTSDGGCEAVDGGEEEDDTGRRVVARETGDRALGGQHIPNDPKQQRHFVDLSQQPFRLVENAQNAGEAETPAGLLRLPDPAVSTELSSFLIDNANAFAACEGFDAICYRIRDEARPVGLAFVMLYLRLLLALQSLFRGRESKHWAVLADDFYRAVRHRLRHLSDAELKSVQQQPRALMHITSAAARLAASSLGADADAATTVRIQERLILEIMVDFLRLSSIEARLFGLHNILEAVRANSLPGGASFARQGSTSSAGSGVSSHSAGQHAQAQGQSQQQQQQQQQQQEQQQQAPRQAPQQSSPFAAGGAFRGVGGTSAQASLCSFATIGKEWFKSWLVRAEIVNELYASRNLHFELLSRSTAIVLYMGRERVLDGRLLQRIWSASLGRDFATMRVIHNLLVSLMPRLSHEERMLFFKDCVAAIPFHDYDDAGGMLRFISEVTVVALEADGASQHGKLSRSPSSGRLGSPDSGPMSRKSLSPTPRVPSTGSLSLGIVKGHAGGAKTAPTEGDAFGRGESRMLNFAPDDYWYGLKLLWNFILDDAETPDADTIEHEDSKELSTSSNSSSNSFNPSPRGLEVSKHSAGTDDAANDGDDIDEKAADREKDGSGEKICPHPDVEKSAQQAPASPPTGLSPGNGNGDEEKGRIPDNESTGDNTNGTPRMLEAPGTDGSVVLESKSSESQTGAANVPDGAKRAEALRHGGGGSAAATAQVDRSQNDREPEDFRIDEESEKVLHMNGEKEEASQVNGRKDSLTDDQAVSENNNDGSANAKAAAVAEAADGQAGGSILNRNGLALPLSRQSSYSKPSRSLAQRREAISLLVNLLSGSSRCASQRGRILQNCVELLRKDRSVPQALELLRRIITVSPQAKASWFSISENRRTPTELMIERLDKQHKLVRLVCSGLTHYQARIRMVASGLPGSRLDPSEVDAYCLPGSVFSHLDQLSERFDFLLFILTNSYLHLKRTAAKELWMAMVVAAPTERSQDVALLWFARGQASGIRRVSQLQEELAEAGSSPGGNASAAVGTQQQPTPAQVGTKSAQKDGGATAAKGNHGKTQSGDLVSKNSVFSEDVALYLFREHMQSLGAEALTPTAFRVYQSFFVAINYRAKNLRRARPEHNGTFLARRTRRDQESRALSRAMLSAPHTNFLFQLIERHGSSLDGVEFLWRVALEARRNEVGFAAVSHLVHLHTQVAHRLKGRKGKLQMEFVQLCARKIAEAHKISKAGVDLAKMLRQARRASAMLKLFLGHYSAETSVSDLTIVIIPPAVGFPGSLTRREYIPIGPGTSFTLRLGANATLADLRKLVADKIKVPDFSLTLRLVNNPCRVPDPSSGFDDWFADEDEEGAFAGASPEEKSDAAQRSSVDVSVRSIGQNPGLAVDTTPFKDKPVQPEEGKAVAGGTVAVGTEGAERDKASPVASQKLELRDAPRPFPDSDLQRTLKEIGLRDWDSIKVLDVKLERAPVPGSGSNGAPRKERLQPVGGDERRQDQMVALATPLVQKSLEIGYVSPVLAWQAESATPLPKASTRSEDGAAPEDASVNVSGLTFPADFVNAICEDMFQVLDPSPGRGTTIVSSDRIAAQNVWDCLLLLQADEAMVREIESLEHDWNRLLPMHSTHRLLYALRIVRRKMDLERAFETPKFELLSESHPLTALVDQSDWMKRFVSGAGTEHLLRILLNHRSLTGPRRIECISVLVQLLSALLFADEGFRKRLGYFLQAPARVANLASPSAAAGSVVSGMSAADDDGPWSPVQATSPATSPLQNADAEHLVPSAGTAAASNGPASGDESAFWRLASMINIKGRRVVRRARRNTATPAPNRSVPADQVDFPLEDNVLPAMDKIGAEGAAAEPDQAVEVDAGPGAEAANGSGDSDEKPEAEEEADRHRHPVKHSLAPPLEDVHACRPEEFPRIVECALEAMLLCTSEAFISVDKIRSVVDRGMYLVMSCIAVGNVDTMRAFIHFEHIRELTEQLVIYCEDQVTRKRACISLLTLCSLVNTCDEMDDDTSFAERRAFSRDYLVLLLPIDRAMHAPLRSDQRDGMLVRRAHRNLSSSCREFHMLLVGLIDMVDKTLVTSPGSAAPDARGEVSPRSCERDDDQSGDQSFDLEEDEMAPSLTCEIFLRSLDALLIHESLESFHTDREDQLMIGLLRLLRTVVAKDTSLKTLAAEHNLLKFLYHDLLFANSYTFEGDRARLEMIRSEARQNQNGAPVAPASPNTPSMSSRERRDSSGQHPRVRARGMLRRSFSGQSLILHDRSALCKSEASRDAAFALLMELLEESPANVALFCEIIEEEGIGGSAKLSFRARFAKEWHYNPLGLAKHPQQFTGLQNLGATCYMNSFLQQLFHIPSFAEAILSIPSVQSGTLLHQLQVTFGSLRVSTKHYYDPFPFCKALAEVNGVAIDLSEQRDVVEFASQLFEQVETESEQAREVVQSHFRGLLVNQIISKDPNNPYVSERPDPFHCLPLDIKGCSTLPEALEAMVQSELLTGDNQYKLESGERVDAIKRTCIKEVPDHLIINLKRFEFDLQTLTRRKLNDRFEFPLVLDLEPYTYDYISKHTPARTPSSRDDSTDGGSVSPETASGSGTVSGSGSVDGDHEQRDLDRVGEAQGRLASGFYKYELVGVIAHTGTMDSGHYYSFVRERRPRYPKVGGQWVEFNDKFVWPYPIDCIPGDCFGGKERILRNDGSVVEVVKSRSAYMLVYDRKVSHADEGTWSADASPETRLGRSPGLWSDLEDLEGGKLGLGQSSEDDDEDDDVDDEEDYDGAMNVDEELGAHTEAAAAAAAAVGDLGNRDRENSRIAVPLLEEDEDDEEGNKSVLLDDEASPPAKSPTDEPNGRYQERAGLGPSSGLKSVARTVEGLGERLEGGLGREDAFATDGPHSSAGVSDEDRVDTDLEAEVEDDEDGADDRGHVDDHGEDASAAFTAAATTTTSARPRGDQTYRNDNVDEDDDDDDDEDLPAPPLITMEQAGMLRRFSPSSPQEILAMLDAAGSEGGSGRDSGRSSKDASDNFRTSFGSADGSSFRLSLSPITRSSRRGAGRHARQRHGRPWDNVAKDGGVDERGIEMLRHFMHRRRRRNSARLDASALAYASRAQGSHEGRDGNPRASMLKLPSHVVDALLKDNLTFIRFNYVFDASTFKFAWNLMRLGLEPEMEASRETITRLCTQFMLDVPAHGWGTLVEGLFPEWEHCLLELIRGSSGAQRWLLTYMEDEERLQQVFLLCPKPTIRQAMARLLVASVEAQALGNADGVATFIRAFDSSLRQHVTSVDACVQYFVVMEAYASLGEAESDTLLDIGLLRSVTKIYVSYEGSGPTSGSRAAAVLLRVLVSRAAQRRLIRKRSRRHYSVLDDLIVMDESQQAAKQDEAEDLVQESKHLKGEATQRAQPSDHKESGQAETHEAPLDSESAVRDKDEAPADSHAEPFTGASAAKSAGEKSDAEGEVEADEGPAEDEDVDDGLVSLAMNVALWKRLIYLDEACAVQVMQDLGRSSERIAMGLASFLVSSALQRRPATAVHPKVAILFRMLKQLLLPCPEWRPFAMRVRATHVVNKLVQEMITAQGKQVARWELLVFHGSKMLLACAAQSPEVRACVRAHESELVALSQATGKRLSHH